MVSESGSPGIDMEKIEPRGTNFDELTFADAELDRLPAPLDDEWRARLWTAKEAAAKATGLGLQGNPRRFEVQSVAGEVIVVNGRSLTTTIVEDPDGERYAVAWTDDSEGHSHD
jgi:phosphopantetheinyl transferase